MKRRQFLKGAAGLAATAAVPISLSGHSGYWGTSIPEIVRRNSDWSPGHYIAKALLPGIKKHYDEAYSGMTDYDNLFT